MCADDQVLNLPLERKFQAPNVVFVIISVVNAPNQHTSHFFIFYFCMYKLKTKSVSAVVTPPAFTRYTLESKLIPTYIWKLLLIPIL